MVKKSKIKTRDYEELLELQNSVHSRLVDGKIVLADRDFLGAIDLVKLVQKNKWSYKKIAWLFGTDPAQMCMVFRSKDEWTDPDLISWNIAIARYQRLVKRLKTDRDTSVIIKPNGTKKRTP